MDNLQALIARLDSAPHGELRLIERSTGIAYSTIRRIRDGKIGNPGLTTFQKLADYYRPKIVSPRRAKGGL